MRDEKDWTSDGWINDPVFGDADVQATAARLGITTRELRSRAIAALEALSGGNRPLFSREDIAYVFRDQGEAQKAHTARGGKEACRDSWCEICHEDLYPTGPTEPFEPHGSAP
jgi:hypothetical protein